LKILSLLNINIDGWKTSVFLFFSFSGFSDETLGDAGSGLLGEDALVLHVLKDEAGGFGESLGAGVDFELRMSGCFVGVRDAGEDWNDSSASLLVKTFDVAAFANLERSTDVALEELKATLLVQVLSEVAVLRVWRDEGDEHDHARHVKQLRHLRNTADVLGAVLGGETKTLVKSSSDDITIKDENLSRVSSKTVNSLLECFR
jgi:hypothetical protein